MCSKSSWMPCFHYAISVELLNPTFIYSFCSSRWLFINIYGCVLSFLTCLVAGEESLLPGARHYNRHQRRQQVDEQRRSSGWGQCKRHVFFFPHLTSACNVWELALRLLLLWHWVDCVDSKNNLLIIIFLICYLAGVWTCREILKPNFPSQSDTASILFFVVLLQSTVTSHLPKQKL